MPPNTHNTPSAPSQTSIIDEYRTMELSVITREPSAKESLNWLPSEGQTQGRNQTSTFSSTLWHQIKKQRIANWSLLSQIHEIRRILREKQREKSTADDALLRKMMGGQPLWRPQLNRELSQEHKNLLDLRENCQQIRDDYGPLEDDCNELEDQLSSQEFRLGKMEEELYSLQSREFVAVATDLDLEARPEEHEEQSGGDFDESELYKFHPQVDVFLSRLGDLDLLRERLDDLLMEYEHLREEEVKLARVGRGINSGNQSFIDGFEVAHRELLQQIRLTGREVHIMRQDCLKRRLIDENDEPTDLKVQEEIQFVEEKELELLHSTSDYVKYPLLLPRPGKKAGLTRSELAHDKTTDSTSKRINEWLLEKLRISPLDVMLLASTFEKKGCKIDERWEVCVLAFWFNDEIKTWNPDTASYSSPSLQDSYASEATVKEAYLGAIGYLQRELKGNSEREWIKNADASISGVVDAVNIAKVDMALKDGHRFAEARKCVDNFATKVPDYGRVLDTIPQHHPEYIALIWGVLKFLLHGIVMHTELSVEVLQAMFKIGEVLPFVKSRLDNYRKTYMIKAVSRVYAHIMLFLQLAVKWYRLRATSDVLRVVRGPIVLSYRKTVEEIHACKEYIDMLTNVEYPSEAHGLVAFIKQQDQTLRQMRDDLSARTQKSPEHDSKLSHSFLVAILTKPKLEKLSLEAGSQRKHIRDMYYMDVLDILRPQRSLVDLLLTSQSLSPKGRLLEPRKQDQCLFLRALVDWLSMPESSIYFLQSNLGTEISTKQMAIPVAHRLRRSAYEIIWYISGSHDDDKQRDLVDVLKVLIFQLLKSENVSLVASKYQSHHLEREWKALFFLLLRKVSRCLMIIQAESVLSRKISTPSLSTALSAIAEQAIANAKRDNNILKVLLVTYSTHKEQTFSMDFG
ncbi:hypothetical protein BJ875DRAFT_408011 [Amylocarpus encephaloides]|uniref:DUF7708 domain-containing protein n=1 Tax=Amylocarpus encephaloides TaxID=45428 RepID=A0A9P8C2D8_9HELO|nr:hypothetical protein BJ875DRAFT_408011 [Amylocarpus encephaloides]